jgi:hypothetical protein
MWFHPLISHVLLIDRFHELYEDIFVYRKGTSQLNNQFIRAKMELSNIFHHCEKKLSG